MKHVHVDLHFDVPDEATDDEVVNVIENAVVQIIEPITDNDTDATWRRPVLMQSTYTEIDGRPLL